MARIKSSIRRIIDITPYWFSVYKFFSLCIRNGSNAHPPKLKNLLSTRVYQYRQIRPFSSEKDPLPNIIFTTNQGVFVTSHSNHRIKQLLKGKFYGITKYRDYWIFARSNNYTPSKVPNDKSRRQSDICAIKLSENEIDEYFVLLWGIPGEIHQIDIFQDKLHMPHTGFNQVLSIPLSKLFSNGKPIQKPKTMLACQSIALKIQPSSHLNSIFHSEEVGITYIVAHNSTAHTGRYSDILLLYNGSSDVTIRHTQSHSAHNVCELEGKILYCDSNNWRLMREDDCIFKTNMLLRGLSVTDNLLFIGGSEIDFTGKKRDGSNCYVYVLNHDGELIAHHEFVGLGNLMEIRQLVHKDYGMSSPN